MAAGRAEREAREGLEINDAARWDWPIANSKEEGAQNGSIDPSHIVGYLARP